LLAFHEFDAHLTCSPDSNSTGSGSGGRSHAKMRGTDTMASASNGDFHPPILPAREAKSTRQIQPVFERVNDSPFVDEASGQVGLQCEHLVLRRILGGAMKLNLLTACVTSSGTKETGQAIPPRYRTQGT
jgi:hypothetical protein